MTLSDADLAEGLARTRAAMKFGDEIARSGMFQGRLFAQPAVSAARLPDPIHRVTHLMLVRAVDNRASNRFADDLIATVAAIDPAIRCLVWEFVDLDGFRPVDADWQADDDQRFFNHRTMSLRLAVSRPGEAPQATAWLEMPHTVPWPYVRDLLIPFLVPTGHDLAPGFVQPFHGAVLAPLTRWLHAEFAPQGMVFTAFAPRAETGVLEANTQDHGGGVVPVTPTLAVIGRGMSQRLKSELRRLGIDTIESETPTETRHVDELFAVLPDRGTAAGRALVVPEPSEADDRPETRRTVQAIRRATRRVADAVRRRPGFADLRVFTLPVAIAGRHPTDFNPVNLVALPQDDRLDCLLGAMEAPAEAAIRSALTEIGQAIGLPITPHFVDLSDIAPGHKGSLHCATLELRRP